jgi:hypothetical protein
MDEKSGNYQKHDIKAQYFTDFHVFNLYPSVYWDHNVNLIYFIIFSIYKLTTFLAREADQIFVLKT